MARIYATEDETGRRILVRIECDACSATIKPHPDIAESGWVKVGTIEFGTRVDSDFCPDHARG